METAPNAVLSTHVASRRDPHAWIMIAGPLAIVAGVASIPLIEVVGTWMQMRAIEREWTIDGPPCAEVAAPSARSVGPRRPPHTATFMGVSFVRWYGWMNCQGVSDHHGGDFPVCQFNSPGAVRVTVGGRTTTYEVGAGHTVTVSTRGGRARCVRAGWWRGFDD